MEKRPLKERPNTLFMLGILTISFLIITRQIFYDFSATLETKSVASLSVPQIVSYMQAPVVLSVLFVWKERELKERESGDSDN